MTLLKKAAVGTAHGKIILIGEHAVVYNMPAIALPFMATTITVRITEKEGETHITSDYFTGYLSQVPEALYGFKEALIMVANHLDVSEQGLNIHVDSQIPSERGMGSSAAVATALIKALCNYFDYEIDEDTLKNFVDVAEKITHGNPSGIDTTVVNSSNPIYFKKNQPPAFIPLNLDGFLIAADTGIKGNTKEAVSDVGKLVDSAKSQTMKVIEKIGDLTGKAKVTITENNVLSLGEIMNQTHRLLKQLTVSSDELDHLVQAALQAGACGAKLTGGGRGGCMIALAKTSDHAKEIAQALTEAGAIKTWIHPLNSGVDVNE